MKIEIMGIITITLDHQRKLNKMGYLVLVQYKEMTLLKLSKKSKSKDSSSKLSPNLYLMNLNNSKINSHLVITLP